MRPDVKLFDPAKKLHSPRLECRKHNWNERWINRYRFTWACEHVRQSGVKNRKLLSCTPKSINKYLFQVRSSWRSWSLMNWKLNYRICYEADVSFITWAVHLILCIKVLDEFIVLGKVPKGLVSKIWTTCHSVLTQRSILFSPLYRLVKSVL